MGPSKEELANYYKNNRKYFDELAKHFKQTDTAYYNQYIAPFYDNSFVSISGKRSGRPIIAIFVAMLAVLISGIIMFFVANKESSNVREYEKNGAKQKINTDSINDNYDIQSDQREMLDTLSTIKDLGDYEKGIMYYNFGDYDKAKKYLQKIQRNDILYKDAKEKLKEISNKKENSKNR